MKNYVFFSLFIFAIIFCSCSRETKKAIAIQQPNNEIIKADFICALDTYGVPQSMEQFTHIASKEVVPAGIRQRLYEAFPEGKKVTILEAIWNKNDSTEIAIWYTKKEKRWIPFSHFAYDKYIDF